MLQKAVQVLDLPLQGAQPCKGLLVPLLGLHMGNQLLHRLDLYGHVNDLRLDVPQCQWKDKLSFMPDAAETVYILSPEKPWVSFPDLLKVGQGKLSCHKSADPCRSWQLVCVYAQLS